MDLIILSVLDVQVVDISKEPLVLPYVFKGNLEILPQMFATNAISNALLAQELLMPNVILVKGLDI